MLLNIGVGGVVGGTESGAASVVKVIGVDGALLLWPVYCERDRVHAEGVRGAGGEVGQREGAAGRAPVLLPHVVDAPLDHVLKVVGVVGPPQVRAAVGDMDDLQLGGRR